MPARAPKGAQGSAGGGGGGMSKKQKPGRRIAGPSYQVGCYLQVGPWGNTEAQAAGSRSAELRLRLSATPTRIWFPR